MAGVKAIACITGIIIGGRTLLRPLYRAISNVGNQEIFAATTLLVVMGTSVLTQIAGLSLALGAFLVRAFVCRGVFGGNAGVCLVGMQVCVWWECRCVFGGNTGCVYEQIMCI